MHRPGEKSWIKFVVPHLGFALVFPAGFVCNPPLMVDDPNHELEGLILACGRGNRSAFKALYEATSPRFFGAARKLLKDHGLAQDAVQEGFLKIWHNAQRFDPKKGSPMAWMGIIIRRAALDRMRSIRHHDTLDGIEVEAPHFEPSDPKVNKCLEGLPETQGRALILSYVYGYTHEEIANSMEKPVGTIKSWVRRAGIALKECLEA